MSEDERVFDVSPQGPYPSGTPQSPNPHAPKSHAAQHESQGNPYAAPNVAMGPPPVRDISELDEYQIWSYGNKLIMRRGVELPDVCVQTGVPEPGIRKRRKISWSPPWVPLLIFAGLLPLVIVSLIMTKRATVRFSVCEQQHQRRRNAVMVGWIIGLAGIGLTVLAIYLANTQQNVLGDNTQWFVLGLLGFIVALAGLVYGTHMGLPFKPAKITSDYVMLRGLGSNFVSRFPAWPYQPL